MTPGDLADEFGAAADRAEQMAPVLDQFVNEMITSIQKNFAYEGRPDAWAPVKNPEHKGHVRILEDTGTLKNSATAFRDGMDVVLTAGAGQPAGKAPALQYGAQLHNKRRAISGRFVSRRSWKGVSVGGGVLPARPYLLFQPEDLAFFGDALPSYIFMSVKF